ncbi:NADPH-dependent FMN reductase [Aliarcobacter skirrowii]|jgi:NAD(P)H-dependent FMN reductase|uniref:NAD(P)H-dependent oxidoreductase n=2 Tax=Aliarcobacter skirrowii TaxID=28200 RepID=A0A2U2C0D1_9BACT|nr:NAD(P)H-dependent oxidoreductase [Aliarcobacter skirrowii]AXX84432.1 NADPH-dependent FMN reductase [Aliarcobacter skirrowii CCUG 10374]AZL53562.1 NADPH-dependent oxidoreductase [Aliarcobacter skirrowii]KAB0621394.1 NAD(P)H-dependent oxidoreductase [Aliarcobacter skirrowii CCUG 10374]MDD2508061.1 NAD(P)H-dependent oxidoreductase [Aliarcobacter skirrowii]MDD3025922.1 NAD(P)H-dependent oxidoreductase [Aliarcobacter skirrowii]
MSKIGILVASSNNNLKLANELKNIADELNFDSEIINLVDYNLPLYSTVEEDKNGIPESVLDLTTKIMDLKAFIVVAPEYNGVMPPVLNNAMAWTSRSTKNWRDAFNDKIVALATHSGGGGQKGLQAMRIMFQHLGANILAREILTTYEKALNKDSAQEILKALVKLSDV